MYLDVKPQDNRNKTVSTVKCVSKKAKVFKIHLYISSTLFGLNAFSKCLNVNKITKCNLYIYPLFRPLYLKRV